MSVSKSTSTISTTINKLIQNAPSVSIILQDGFLDFQHAYFSTACTFVCLRRISAGQQTTYALPPSELMDTDMMTSQKQLWGGDLNEVTV